MKRFFFIALVLMTTIANSQNVTASLGMSASRSAIIGLEFNTNTIGMYVNRHFIGNDIMGLPLVTPNSPNYNKSFGIDTYYDGVMFGVNWHTGMNDIMLSGGFGSLNEYKVRKLTSPNGEPKYYSEYDQVLAFEFMVGKDFKVNKNVCFGVKGGVNSKASIIGIASIGYYFK